MRRREVITLVGGAAAWPFYARAQQSKSVSRLGFLTQAPDRSPIEEAFLQGLHDLGYVQGQNLLIEYRSGAGKPDRLVEVADELVAANVDIIFAAGSEATNAARQKTTTIPIVMTSTNPGGNVTGVSLLGPEVAGKRLELLTDLIPGVTKITVLWNPNDPGAWFSLRETQIAAETLSANLQIFEVRDVNAFEGAFLAATKEGSKALVLLPAPLMSRNAARIADLAMAHRLPTLFYSEDSVKVGGLVSYGANLIAIYRRAAYFVDRILKGARPAELPVEQPTKFELAINLKTAKAIGLEVPPMLLARADKVIE
jgi:putative tryptophan/tyrosine transport system substrate-binding protein